MAKAETFQDLALAPPSPGQELWRWLCGEVRAAILEGRLKPNARMPSTRSLARQYKLARGTATAAFDQLHSEGFLVTRRGAGTFVAATLPDETVAAEENRAATEIPPSRAGLSNCGRAMIHGVRLLAPSRSLGKAFRSYEPAIDLFPVNQWSRVAGRVLRRAPRSLYGQGDAHGYLPLRRAIAEYVGASRGVRSSADQVLVTSGAQHALDLTARLLLDPGDAVWCEDPGYPGAFCALRAAGAHLVPVPVDAEGIVVEAARARSPRARLAYVTPSNQFPLGVTMSMERRRALLAWAAGADAWVIEDEYDAEYRYFGRPQPALASLDSSGCVLYAGTFTKMLFNSLRIGFLVLPERLVEAYAAARSITDRHPPTLEQAILAEFILDGHFGLHVRRMRQTYAERMSLLVDEAQRHLGGLLEVERAAAGMRAMAWLRTPEGDRQAAGRARARGLELAALSDFTLEYPQPAALILGFAGCTPREIRRGMEVLAAALETGAAEAPAAGIA